VAVDRAYLVPYHTMGGVAKPGAESPLLSGWKVASALTVMEPFTKVLRKGRYNMKARTVLGVATGSTFTVHVLLDTA
jgi:hypothetical protein